MVGSKCQNSIFLEHGHVAYKIKGNHRCSYMLEIILAGNPLPSPLTLGSKGQNSIFIEHYHIKLNRFSNSEMWQQIFCLYTFSLPHLTLGVGLKVKIQLIENMVMLHMKLKRIAKAATCKYFGCRSPLPVVKSQLVQNMVVLHIKLEGITNAAAL